jgi:serine/threonine protein kinase
MIICATCGEETTDEDRCEQCGEAALLDGRFRLTEILGEGASGLTYRAERLDDGMEVAIKELVIRSMKSLKVQELFERESGVLESLDHPAIPSYIDDFVAGQGRRLSLYLVQELIDGHTLHEELERRRFDEESALEVLAELLDVLAYLHGLGSPVIHRDIKPKNVMRRTEDDRLMLIDFGSVQAAIQEADVGGSTIAGTFGYMAPEQLVGRASKATDIYSSAVLLIALLTRRDPSDFVGADTRLDWQSAVSVSPSTERLLEDMLHPVPTERADDAGTLASRVRSILDDASAPETAAPETAAPESADPESADSGSADSPTGRRVSHSTGVGATIDVAAENDSKSTTVFTALFLFLWFPGVIVLALVLPSSSENESGTKPIVASEPSPNLLELDESEPSSDPPLLSLAEPTPLADPGSLYAAIRGHGLYLIDENQELTHIGTYSGSTSDIAVHRSTAYMATGDSIFRTRGASLKKLGDPKHPGRVGRLATSEDNALWATGFRGLLGFETGTWTRVSADQFGAGVGEFRDVAAAGERVYAITRKQLFVRTQRRWREVDISVLGSNSLERIDAHPDGSVLITGYHGLAVGRDGQWGLVENAPDDVRIRLLSVAPDGRVHLGSQTDSAYSVNAAHVLDQDDVRQLELSSAKIDAEEIHAIAGDGRGRTWLGTDTGVVVWSEDDSRRVWRPTVEGLPSARVDALVVTRGGPALSPPAEVDSP